MTDFPKKHDSPILSITSKVSLPNWMCDHMAIARNRWLKKPSPTTGYSSENPKFYRTQIIWIKRLCKEFDGYADDLDVELAIMEAWRENVPYTTATKVAFAENRRAIRFKLKHIKERAAKLIEAAKKREQDDVPVPAGTGFKDFGIKRKKKTIAELIKEEEEERNGQKES